MTTPVLDASGLLDIEITDEMLEVLAWRLIVHYGDPDAAITALTN